MGQVGVGFLQPCDDFNMLGAKRFAGAAFHAAIGFVFIRDVIFIGILTPLAFVVHERGVIKFKHGGYGYPTGAGQAVFTVGARHRREGLPGLARLVYDCQVFARGNGVPDAEYLKPARRVWGG